MDIEHIITELNFQTGEDVQVNRTMTHSDSIRLSFDAGDAGNYADFTREEAEHVLQAVESAHRLGIEDAKSLQELPH